MCTSKYTIYCDPKRRQTHQAKPDNLIHSLEGLADGLFSLHEQPTTLGGTKNGSHYNTPIKASNVLPAYSSHAIPLHTMSQVTHARMNNPRERESRRQQLGYLKYNGS